MWRLGALALCVVLFAAGVSAATIRADPATTSETTTDTTTTETTSTDETTTTPTTTTTTTSATTTVATTPAATTTTTTTTTAPPRPKTLSSSVRPIAGGCLLVGGVLVLGPHRPARVLGPVAQAPGATTARRTGGVTYPADGSIAAAASIDLRTSGCGRKATGSAVLRSLSLFGGAITAKRVELAARGTGSRIVGLELRGKAVAAAAIAPGRHLPVGNWAYAVALPRPLPAKRSVDASVLAVHLLRRHAGLPAGTVLLVAFAAVPRPPKAAATPKPKRTHARAKQKRVHRLSPAAVHRHQERVAERLGQPLRVTPALGLRHYIFPVAGHSDYIDTYGAFRGDVPGNWHHGDDIFAALGTPVLAVATGTLNRVGWQRLGGWRLWVRDSRRNEFYYAHLSGYSPLALHSKQVKAGDVIGFVGNTGDAFTTSPHVHFEVHPHQLLRLHYNGAVNPTGYLDQWRHLEHVHAPRPVHPGFPPGAVHKEASYVWRQLLASRGLIKHGPTPKDRPKIPVPLEGLDRQALATPELSVGAGAKGGGGLSTILLASLLAVLAAALAGAMVARRKLATPRQATWLRQVATPRLVRFAKVATPRHAMWRRHASPPPEASDDADPGAATVSDAVDRLARVLRSLRARA